MVFPKQPAVLAPPVLPQANSMTATGLQSRDIQWQDMHNIAAPSDVPLWFFRLPAEETGETAAFFRSLLAGALLRVMAFSQLAPLGAY